MDIDTKITIPLKDYQNTKGKQLTRIEKIYGSRKYVLTTGRNGVKE